MQIGARFAGLTQQKILQLHVIQIMWVTGGHVIPVNLEILTKYMKVKQPDQPQLEDQNIGKGTRMGKVPMFCSNTNC